MATTRRATASRCSGVSEFLAGVFGGVVAIAVGILFGLFALGAVGVGYLLSQQCCETKAPTGQIELLEAKHRAELEKAEAQWEAKRLREEVKKLSTRKPTPTRKPAAPKAWAPKPKPENTAGGNTWYHLYCKQVEPQHPVTCPDRPLR